MSQFYFSKLEPLEKEMRLQLAATSRAELTLWVKGSKEKFKTTAVNFNKNKNEITTEGKLSFLPGAQILASFEVRGMNFFSQIKVLQVDSEGMKLYFHSELFKSERRNSFRLLTYPMYNINAYIDLGEQYKGSGVSNISKKPTQTEIFKSFLKLVEDQSASDRTIGKFRIQDLSVTGMSINIADLESDIFVKDHIFHNVRLDFSDDEIIIPELKVVYVINTISTDKSGQKYKVGLQFNQLPNLIDDHLGRKINKLLRDNDSDKEFENFIK